MNKKIVILLMVVVLISTLIGCGKKPEEPETVATESTEIVETMVEETEVYVPGAAKNILSEEDFEEVTTTEETQPSNAAATEATDPESKEEDKQAEATDPSSPSEEGIQETTEATTPVTEELTEYEKYHAMSGAEQKAFTDSFGSMEAFFEWYNAARAEYEGKNAEIPEDGVIELG